MKTFTQIVYYESDVADFGKLVESKGGKVKGYQQRGREYIIFYEAEENVHGCIKI
jgi:hypothetical protein